MKPKPTLPVKLSYLRMAAQLLVPSLQKQTVPDVVRHLLAMQGQQVYSFPHAAFIRTVNADFQEVQKTFEEQKIIRHRPMRGTVHITCAEDYHWLRLTLNQNPSPSILRAESLANITESVFIEAAGNAYIAIENSPEPGVNRKDLFAQWIKYFEHRIPSDISKSQFCKLLMWGLDRRGLLVEGPLRKNQHLFIDARVFPAADSRQSGFYLSSETSTKAALAEVAYRYVQGHGPVSVADFARWTSRNKKSAFDALETNVAQGRLERYQISKEGLTLPQPHSPIDQIYYMQPQLLETLRKYRDELNQILFLPAFDEIHVGYENRTCLTDEAGENAICPAKNGMFKPMIIKDGRLIAVYPKTGLHWLEKPIPQLEKAVTSKIQAIEARMSR